MEKFCFECRNAIGKDFVNQKGDDIYYSCNKPIKTNHGISTGVLHNENHDCKYFEPGTPPVVKDETDGIYI